MLRRTRSIPKWNTCRASTSALDTPTPTNCTFSRVPFGIKVNLLAKLGQVIRGKDKRRLFHFLNFTLLYRCPVAYLCSESSVIALTLHLCMVDISDWAVNIQRDSIASYIGHPSMLTYFGTALNESPARVRYNLLQRMVSPCGPPPAKEEEDDE